MYFNGYRNKIKYLTRTNAELAIFAILLRPFGFLAPNFFFILIGFARNWWRLFQKGVVRTTFDIYVFLREYCYELCRFDEGLNVPKCISELVIVLNIVEILLAGY